MPHKVTRKLDELEIGALGTELGDALGKRIALTLLREDDGGTRVQVHDLDAGGAVVDVDDRILQRVVKAHKARPGANKTPGPDTAPTAPAAPVVVPVLPRVGVTSGPVTPIYT